LGDDAAVHRRLLAQLVHGRGQVFQGGGVGVATVGGSVGSFGSLRGRTIVLEEDLNHVRMEKFAQTKVLLLLKEASELAVPLGQVGAIRLLLVCFGAAQLLDVGRALDQRVAFVGKGRTESSLLGLEHIAASVRTSQ